MGHRITQRIFVCEDCGRIPGDGEHLWEMRGEYICAICIDKYDEQDSEFDELYEES